MARKRSRTRKKLDPEEIQDICHMVLMEGEFLKTVAKEHRVTFVDEDGTEFEARTIFNLQCSNQ